MFPKATYLSFSLRVQRELHNTSSHRNLLRYYNDDSVQAALLLGSCSMKIL